MYEGILSQLKRCVGYISLGKDHADSLEVHKLCIFNLFEILIIVKSIAVLSVLFYLIERLVGSIENVRKLGTCTGYVHGTYGCTQRDIHFLSDKSLGSLQEVHVYIFCYFSYIVFGIYLF